MFDYNSLLGRSYVEGETDCFGLMREYFFGQWGIRIPNVSRPTRFWEDPNLNLYDFHKQSDFREVIDVRPQVGDVLLMPIGTAFATHAAVLVASNQILHHLPGSLSRLDDLRPRWIDRAVSILRHPEVTRIHVQVNPPRYLQDVIDVAVLRNPDVQDAIAREMAIRV